MSDNPRDTQFQGFAKVLLDELCEASIVMVETPFQDDWREEWEVTIARRAYDLVSHTIRNTSSRDLDVLDYDEIPPRIPDMLELPKEQK
jgi:hypothetical protein